MILLLACASTPPSDTVTYGGWVYDGPLYEDVVSDGTMTFLFSDRDPIAADQIYDGYPGYWVADVPPGEPFQLRLEGEAAAYPSVWAGDSPSANGSWLQGALFAAQTTYWDELVAGLAPGLSDTPGLLSEGAVHLWGMPTDGTSWDCASLTVAGRPPVCLDLLEDGTLVPVESGPFYWFFAFDLEPGTITIANDAVAFESWTAQPGDLVMAFWMEPP